MKMDIAIKSFVVTSCLALSGAQALGSTRAWSFATEQDNVSITRMSVDGRKALFTVASGHDYVFTYDGANWVKDATLAHPGDSPVAVQDTDFVLTSTSNQVAFFRLVRTGGNLSWAGAGMATVPASSLSSLYIRCAATNSAVCVKPPASETWLARAGDACVRLDVPAAVAYSARYLGMGGSFLASWESGGELQARVYSASTGAVMASNSWGAVGWGYSFVAADGFYIWRDAEKRLEHYGVADLSLARTVELPGCYAPHSLVSVNGVLYVVAEETASGLNRLTAVGGGGELYTRTAQIGGVDWMAENGVMATSQCNPGGNGNNDNARVLRLTDGTVLTHSLFSESGPDRGQALAAAGGSYFAAKACFWWDGVEIREIGPKIGPWQGPDGSSLGALQPLFAEAVALPLASIGGSSSVQITFTNTASYAIQARLYVDALDGDGADFAAAPSVLYVPGYGTATASVTYTPSLEGPVYATLKYFENSDTTFSAVTLAARTPSAAPVLAPALTSKLEGYARAQSRYLTNSASMNLACGWPRSWYSASHINEGYVVMHEVGLAGVCLAVAAERGWLPAENAWEIVGKSLATMETVQANTNEFVDGSFYRYYWIRHPSGADRLPGEVVRDPGAGNNPSSDDNALLVHSLLLVRELAENSRRASTVRSVDRVLSKLNLRRFLRPEGDSVAMWRSASGAYSPLPDWDTVSTEGMPIAAALYGMNQITTAGYSDVINDMQRGYGWYQDRLVPYGDYSAPLFVRIVRSICGMPVAPEDGTGAAYWMSCVPLVRAQLAYADEVGCETVLSHVMSQTVSGVPQVGVAPGNTRGAGLSGQSRSGPHAWFIPFARPLWLDRRTMNRLLAMMDAYEPLYYTDEMGWECAVPFTSAPPHQGTDAGSSDERVYELLNAAYIVLSVHDALLVSEGAKPLVASHPLAGTMAELSAFADAGDPVDVPPLLITGVEKAGSDAAVTFQTLGMGLTNFVLWGSASPGSGYADETGAAFSNRWGGSYSVTTFADQPFRFFRVVSP